MKNAEVLRPESGCAPRVYYLNKPKRFVAATVVDLDADEVVIDATAMLQRVSDETVVATMQSDEMGDVFIENVEPDNYYLWIQKEGYVTRRIPADTREKDVAIPELQFSTEPVKA